MNLFNKRWDIHYFTTLQAMAQIVVVLVSIRKPSIIEVTLVYVHWATYCRNGISEDNKRHWSVHFYGWK